MSEQTVASSPEEQPARRSRWVKWALVASLALNLLVFGALATAAWRHRHGDRYVSTSIFGYVHSLPRGRRGDVLQAADGERQKLKPFRAELRQARSDVAAVLVTKPFDPAKFKVAYDALLAAEIRARTQAHNFFTVIVDKLDADERAGLGHWLAKRESRSRRRDAWRRHRANEEAKP